MTRYGASCYNSTGSRCSGRCQPGTVALSTVVMDLFGFTSLGCYNCRPSSGGGGLSTHGEGRGWDCKCNALNATDKAKGDKLAALLIAKYQDLGVQRIIWNRRQTDVPNGMGNWRAYNGQSPHTDHLHIELCWSAARDKPLTVDYVKMVLGDEEDFLAKLTEVEQKRILDQSDKTYKALFDKVNNVEVNVVDELKKALARIEAKLNEGP